MKWYVLQVMTGAEDRIVRALKSQNVEAFSPQELRLIRHGGKWEQKRYFIFPGYVFVLMNYTAELYYILRSLPGAVRLLQTSEGPAPLTPEEAANILCMGAEILTPSILYRRQGGGYDILSGVLANYSDYIVNIDAHRKRATVELQVVGEIKRIELSVDIN